VAAPRLFRPLALFALLFTMSVGCTRAYIQNDGPYELTAVEVLRDDCGLLDSAPGSLWDGELLISGEVLHMRYELMEDMQLVGFFLGGGGGDDGFMLDGSVSNALLEANGRQCSVDQVKVHLEGTTRCATAFDGTLRVRYELRPGQAAECACELWVRYQAVQNSSPCASSP
jgi:hypothetical protein